MAATLTRATPPAPSSSSDAEPLEAANPVAARRPPVVVGAVLAAVAGGMLLAGLLAANLLTRAHARQWPPEDIELDLYLGVVMLPTAGMAAVAAGWALYAVRHDDNLSTLLGLGLTSGLVLAVFNGAFTALRQAGFGPADHTFGALYFANVGAYLALAVGAFVCSVVALLRAVGGQVRPDRHGAVSATLAWAVLLAVGWVGEYVIVWILK